MSARSYTHHELGRDIESISGHYTPQREVRLPYNGREVLCITGHAVLDSSCCGTGNYFYALVPGYITGWQTATGDGGLPVSEVEPVTGEAARREISRLIKGKEDVARVDFW
jgi:hypothetical protein